jgi:hypothetical protein
VLINFAKVVIARTEGIKKKCYCSHFKFYTRPPAGTSEHLTQGAFQFGGEYEKRAS